MDERLQRILAETKSLDPFPHVALKVLDLAAQDGVLPRELIDVIRTDAAVTAKVLKLCNSAYYGVQNTIASLEEAGNYLGVRALSDLVITSCANKYFRRYGDATTSSNSLLWERSIANAMSSRLLAESRGDVDPNRAYTAGLLQDIGLLVLDRFMHADELAIQREVCAGRDLLDAERAVLGMHHAEIGARLASRWKLPAVLVDTIRWHHEPEHAQVDPQLALYVHLGEALARSIEAPEPPAPFPSYGVSQSAIARTGLSNAELLAASDELRQQLASAQEFVDA